MSEMWKDVVGFEGHYEVSDLGRIKSLKVGPGTFRGKILSPAKSPSGYFTVLLYLNRKRFTYRVSTLVCRAFIGYPSKGLQINHKDGVKNNNSLSNLEYVTASENVRHAFRIGLHPKMANQKLVPWEVVFIRAMRHSGHTQKLVASCFDVTFGLVGHILHGRAWKRI